MQDRDLLPDLLPAVDMMRGTVPCCRKESIMSPMLLRPLLPLLMLFLAACGGGGGGGGGGDEDVTYTLVYAVSGTGGTITGVTVQQVPQGGSGTSVTALPAEGYRFVQWSDGVLSATRTDTLVTANRTVSAQFSRLQFTVSYTVTPAEAGQIGGAGASQTVLYGDNSISVTAQAGPGFRFVRWNDNNVSASRQESAVTADQAFVAEFEEATQYSLTYSAGAGGSIQGQASQLVYEGENGTAVTAVGDSGFAFDRWSDDYQTASRTDLNITANLNVTASFYAIGSQVSLSYGAGTGGSISGQTSQLIAAGGDGTQVQAFANPGYSFVRWDDGVLTASRTDTGVTSNLAVVAEFARQTRTVTYTVNNPAWGSITGVTNQVVFWGDDGTLVTAVASSGYRFVRWSDSTLSASRFETNVQNDFSAEALFEEIPPQYTLAYSAGTGGSVSGQVTQVVEQGQEGTSVEAVPAEGYRFVSWSDGIDTAVRTDSNVTANISVVAQFEKRTFAVTYSSNIAGGGFFVPQSTQIVEYGQNAVAVTATANPGYTFIKWADNNSESPTRQELDVRENLSIQAEFAVNPTTTITYVAGEGGSISGTLQQSGAAGLSAEAVVAEPDSGYLFDSWSDGVTTAQRTDVFGASDQTITALFERLTYIVDISAPGVDVSPSTFERVPQGDGIVFTFTARPGNSLESASGCNGSLIGNQYFIESVVANCTVVVSSSLLEQPAPETITAQPANGLVTLGWRLVEGVPAYNIYYATESGVTPQGYALLDNGALVRDVVPPYQVTGLANGQAYYFVITSTTGRGESLPSLEVSATPEGAAASRPVLNDTGIDFCGAAAGGNNNPCQITDPAEQDALTGRDVPLLAAADMRTGAGRGGFRFSKIGADGAVLPDSAVEGTGATDWVCTRDNVTGLIWEVKQDNAASARHHGHRFTWYDTQSADGVPGTSGDTATCGNTLAGLPCNMENYRNAVNDDGMCGGSDWRIPAPVELESLLDYSVDTATTSRPAIDEDWFPNTPADITWTRAPSAASSSAAWFVNFNFGRINSTQSRATAQVVRLVRGPDARTLMRSRYQPAGAQGEIIRDLHTGLEWQRCSVGQTWNAALAQCDGTPSVFNHEQAAALTDAGGFRAPHVHELMTLVYCSSAQDWQQVGKTDLEACPAGSDSPAIYAPAFPGLDDIGLPLYWSADDSQELLQSWVVRFNNGSTGFTTSSNLFPARLVRPVSP
jgi:hypothetical protein